MLKKEKNGVIWFEYEQLQPYPHLRHAVFSRKIDDLKSHQNRQLAFTACDMQPHVRPVFANQVHSSNVHVVHSDTPDYIDNCDALVCKVPNRALCIYHADCQAALFYDPKKACIAAVHCGWRGNCQNIYKNTINALKSTFGSRPEDLLVCISPSLGPQNAEFIHFEKELPSSFWQFQVAPAYFDFWQISRWQLENEGIDLRHIEIAGICTYEQKDLFFSYRRDHQKERNMSTIYMNIAL